MAHTPSQHTSSSHTNFYFSFLYSKPNQTDLIIFYIISQALLRQGRPLFIPTPMSNTRPHKKQKTSHACQSVMLMTTLSLMSQYSQAEEARPTKRRRTDKYIACTHSLEEMLVAEAMLCMGS